MICTLKELAFYTVDHFKIILADTQQSQVIFDGIRVLDPTMSQGLAGIQLTAEMSVSLDRLTNQRQATVADDVGTGLLDDETFHCFTCRVMFHKPAF